jgi:hypothetical protein
MGKTFLVLLPSLFCLLTWGYNVPGQINPQSSTIAIHRDLKVESAVSARYVGITRLLQPEAKVKLALASRALLEEMVNDCEPTDPYQLALAEVHKQFAGQSAAQSDVLSFYLLADVLQHATTLVDVNKTNERTMNKLDSFSELGEMESLRLQMAMDRMSKLMSTLSNLLKKISDTADGIIQNIK